MDYVRTKSIDSIHLSRKDSIDAMFSICHRGNLVVIMQWIDLCEDDEIDADNPIYRFLRAIFYWRAALLVVRLQGSFRRFRKSLIQERLFQPV